MAKTHREEYNLLMRAQKRHSDAPQCDCTNTLSVPSKSDCFASIPGFSVVSFVANVVVAFNVIMFLNWGM